MDVQPALKSDGWATEPFELVERNGKLYGRGSTDDKGPVLGWLHAINAYKGVGEEVSKNNISIVLSFALLNLDILLIIFL